MKKTTGQKKGRKMQNGSSGSQVAARAKFAEKKNFPQAIHNWFRKWKHERMERE